MKGGHLVFVIFLELLFVMTPTSVRAETLRDAVDVILQNHDRILAAKADVVATSERATELFKNSYLPTLNVMSNYGRERRMQMAPGTDTSLTPRETDFKLTQLLWDFGKASANVEVSRLKTAQMQAAMDAAQQTLILDAATAFYHLQRANNVLKFSKQSVENIKRQGDVEDVRVALGRGYTTDVLQVKAQLAGAKAREVQSAGIVAQAREHVRTIFLRNADEILKLTAPKASYLKALPKTMDEAVAIGVQKNPQLNQLQLLADMAMAQKASVQRTNFSPTVQGIAELKYKDQVQGVNEFQDETNVRVELTFPLNLGLSGLNGVEAARQDLEAARRRYEDTRRLVEEQARVSWQNLDTARANAELLNDQADIAKKFLAMAREERNLGKRTLLDILSGETALINAQSDAASADTDVIIAAFTVLQTMGVLDPAILDDDLRTALSPGQADTSTRVSVKESGKVLPKPAKNVTAQQASGKDLGKLADDVPAQQESYVVLPKLANNVPAQQVSLNNSDGPLEIHPAKQLRTKAGKNSLGVSPGKPKILF